MKRFKQKSIYVSLAVSALLAAGSAVAEIEEITVTATSASSRFKMFHSLSQSLAKKRLSNLAS